MNSPKKKLTQCTLTRDIHHHHLPQWAVPDLIKRLENAAQAEAEAEIAAAAAQEEAKREEAAMKAANAAGATLV